MKEIYEQRLAALECYQQQYEQEYGDNEVFESGEDEIDASKFENPNLLFWTAESTERISRSRDD